MAGTSQHRASNGIAVGSDTNENSTPNTEDEAQQNIDELLSPWRRERGNDVRSVRVSVRKPLVERENGDL